MICQRCLHKEKDGHEEPCISCVECGVPYEEWSNAIGLKNMFQEEGEGMEIIRVYNANQAYERILAMYMENNVCLGELISQIEIRGISMESVIEVFTTLCIAVDGEKIFKGREELDTLKKI